MFSVQFVAQVISINRTVKRVWPFMNICKFSEHAP